MSQEDPMVFLRKKREELAVRKFMSIGFKFKHTHTPYISKNTNIGFEFDEQSRGTSIEFSENGS